MSIKISVNQIDGFDESSTNAGCYLSLDGDFIDVITPITGTSDSLTDIPSEGLLRLILKNMRSGNVFGSVSIQANKLKVGTYWLPLFDDIDDDLVSNVPANVDAPRIEVSIANESTESSTLSLAPAKYDIRLEHLQHEYDSALKRAEDRDIKSLQKIKELADGQITLQIENNKLNSLIAEKNLEITYLNEKIKKLSIESYEADYIKQQSLAKELTAELENTHDHIQKLEEELIKYKEINKSLSSIKINACQIHEEENQKMQQQVIGLKQKVFELQKASEKKISDKLEAELIRQIKELDEKLEQSETSKHELYLEISELKQEISNQEKIINELKGHIEGSRTERVSIRDDRARSPKNLRRKDSIDRSLEEYHIGQGIKNNFIKFARGVYEFGNRKVNVSMKNGTIICRVGGGYVQIDDFLNIYMSALTGSPKKVVNPRGQSTSPVRGTKQSFAFLDVPSGKQTPSIDSFLDDESLLTYSRDSEESRGGIRNPRY
ncbi:hypothetical protein SteCoe_7579 [Stentor coeruleus]|uniref:GAR domain-containing protein n=1 Tax=Stentor coeruleus TaxID=5963 RepID=A0A1R2CM52_9CILI|nr:hypothetical protein SteCoe_7579 [Stentor coeruleus]